MNRNCETPLGVGELADYFAGDLDAAAGERLEQHLFGCDACTAEAERVAAIGQAFRTAIPIAVDGEQIAALRARGVRVEENPVVAGTRKPVAFPDGSDVLVHRLQGIDLARAERVEVRVRSESTGEVLGEDHFVPFDRERGEVLIACQRHFSSLPSDIVFDVRALEASGASFVTTFLVPHVFPG
jgi:hypothetical protein